MAQILPPSPADWDGSVIRDSLGNFVPVNKYQPDYPQSLFQPGFYVGPDGRPVVRNVMNQGYMSPGGVGSYEPSTWEDVVNMAMAAAAAGAAYDAGRTFGRNINPKSGPNKYPSWDTMDKYPPRDTMDKYPSRDTMDKYPSRDTMDKYPSRDTMNKYPSRDTMDKYPSRDTMNRAGAEFPKNAKAEFPNNAKANANDYWNRQIRKFPDVSVGRQRPVTISGSKLSRYGGIAALIEQFVNLAGAYADIEQARGNFPVLPSTSRYYDPRGPFDYQNR